MGLRETLAKLEIWDLYYMTHIENIPSILQRGILSYNRVKEMRHLSFALEPVQQRRESVIQLTGKSVHDYVPLYFTTRTPMQYTITKPRTGIISRDDLVFVEVDAFKIFKMRGVIFSDGNAADGETTFYSDPSDLERLRWDYIRLPNYYPLLGSEIMYKAEWRRTKQSEVLVPDLIPVPLFTDIVVSCRDAFSKIEECCRNAGLTPYVSKQMVDSSHYFPRK